MLVNIKLNKPHCPTCNSTNVSLISTGKKSLVDSCLGYSVETSGILTNVIIADINGNYITINFTKIQCYKL